jgi:methylated-DNA-[protein]-cysteine S-methyltransferase
MNHLYLASPLGTLKLVSAEGRVVRIEFPGAHSEDAGRESDSDPALRACSNQLSAYFAGGRRTFELPLGATGTAFQHSVWQALQAIPYGEVRSYRAIAETIGKPRAVRAVGAANGRNPLPIVVPCHRVIGSDGSLTGFAGGLAAKRCLLALEGSLAAPTNPEASGQLLLTEI